MQKKREKKERRKGEGKRVRDVDVQQAQERLEVAGGDDEAELRLLLEVLLDVPQVDEQRDRLAVRDLFRRV